MAATQKKKQQEAPAPQIEARIDRMGFNSTMSIYELPLLSINSPKSNA